MGVTNFDAISLVTKLPATELAGGITNAQLAGSIASEKLAGGITNAQLAGSIAAEKLAGSIPNSALSTPNHTQTFIIPVAGVLAGGAAAAFFDTGLAGTIIDARCSVGTAPTNGGITVDLHMNGVTIYTDQAKRMIVAENGFSSTATLPDVVAVPAGARFTVDIDAVGGTIAGADLSVALTIKRPNV